MLYPRWRQWFNALPENERGNTDTTVYADAWSQEKTEDDIIHTFYHRMQIETLRTLVQWWANHARKWALFLATFAAGVQQVAEHSANTNKLVAEQHLNESMIVKQAKKKKECIEKELRTTAAKKMVLFAAAYDA